MERFLIRASSVISSIGGGGVCRWFPFAVTVAVAVMAAVAAVAVAVAVAAVVNGAGVGGMGRTLATVLAGGAVGVAL